MAQARRVTANTRFPSGLPGGTNRAGLKPENCTTNPVGPQRDALLAAGVDGRHLFADRASGSRVDRAGLAKLLAFLRPSDCLVVWKLDRLGRSLPHLLITVTDLKERGIAFRSLAEQMDTTTPQGELLFHRRPWSGYASNCVMARGGRRIAG